MMTLFWRRVPVAWGAFVVCALCAGGGLWGEQFGNYTYSTRAGAYSAIRLAETPLFQVSSDGDRLNVRDVPNGEVLYRVSHGDRVYALAVTLETVNLDNIRDRWVKVRPLDGGASGWVFGGYLRALQGGAKYPGVSGAVSAGGYTAIHLPEEPLCRVFSDGDKLNVRDVPSGGVLYQVSHGDRVYALEVTQETVWIDGIKDHWVKIQPARGGISGWVFGGYLRTE